MGLKAERTVAVIARVKRRDENANWCGRESSSCCAAKGSRTTGGVCTRTCTLVFTAARDVCARGGD